MRLPPATCLTSPSIRAGETFLIPGSRSGIVLIDGEDRSPRHVPGNDLSLLPLPSRSCQPNAACCGGRRSGNTTRILKRRGRVQRFGFNELGAR